MRALTLTFNLIAGCLCILLSAIPIIFFLFFGILELLNAGGQKSVVLEVFIFSMIGLVAALFTFIFSVSNFRSLRPGGKTGRVIPFQIIILVLNIIQYSAFYYFFYFYWGFDEIVGKVAVAVAGFVSIVAFIFTIVAYINHKKKIAA